MLKESQKADFRLIWDTFQDKAFSHVLVSIVYIRNGLAHQHNIKQFLTGISVLIDQAIFF